MTEDSQAKNWLKLALKGDREAACNLIELYHQRIFAYLHRLAGNETDASDLTQLTFCRAWQSLDKFQGASSVTTWIHRIAYCVYVDWIRRRPKQDPKSDAWWEAVPACEPSPFDSLAESDGARRLYALVEGLEPESRRAAIHLHYYQDLTLAETAEVLGMPVSTVKYQLKSSLDELRNRLSERGQVFPRNLQ